MKARTVFRQDGQTLILVALAMVALMAMLALAVDVGHLYAERRRLQNAADAGALAGARELCFGDPGMAITTAQEYAVVRNGAESADVTIVDGWTVDVLAQETVNHFFAGVIGVPQTDVVAEAAAMCGAANKACGLWPVAFALDLWNDNLDAGCGVPFYVWTGNNPNQDPDCEIYDCDVNEDGIDDVFPLEKRAWLDYSDVVDPRYPDGCSQPGCGTKELSCWIRYDTSARIIVPSCVPGDNGTRSATKDDVEFRIGDTVSVPLYDSMGCEADSCPGGDRYHIVDFACITVLGWEHKLELPRLDGHKPPWSGKAIKAAVNCGGCDTYCGGTSGDPPDPWSVRAVSLTK